MYYWHGDKYDSLISLESYVEEMGCEDTGSTIVMDSIEVLVKSMRTPLVGCTAWACIHCRGERCILGAIELDDIGKCQEFESM